MKKLPDDQMHLNIMYGEYKKSARKRGHHFELSKEEFAGIFKRDCAYCASPPSNQIAGRHAGRFPPHNGLDRVHPARGYTLDNVVPCCRYCNEVKRSRPLDDFKVWAEGIASNIDNIRSIS